MSSGSDSDEEFVPGEPEQLSEEDSADDETDLQFEKEQELKSNKRKAASDSKGKKKRKSTTRRKSPEKEDIDDEEDKKKVDPVQEKKREDDLWAMFLEGTDTKPKSNSSSTQNNAQPIPETAKKDAVPKKETQTSNKIDDAKAKEQRIFEFAGEAIIVEGDIIKEKVKLSEKPELLKITAETSKGRGSGGLSSVLGQINKKNKLSTFEKTKLDWNTYKKVEDVEEEVKSINKGKQGYLDRQDFLDRADMRQYELERQMRMGRRSNR